MSKEHPMAHSSLHFGISPKLQELICLLGQGYVFEEGEEVLNKTLGLEISAKQIQRVSEHYGQVIEDQQEEYIENRQEAPMLSLSQKDESIYAMMDGSMVYTREHGWKEMKVGRLFSGHDCVPIQERRNLITQSIYVCDLGDHKSFFAKWDAYTDRYRKKICIADGAKWIWNWLDANDPETIQILDYFHAVEKAAQFAAYQYPEEQERIEWLETQKERLLNNQVQLVIETLEKTQSISKESEKSRIDVIRYYQNNIKRMNYKTYLESGYLIGSGAIEAAHRNVVQQRLKLSGQRWSAKGAQQIVNLRAYKKSERWSEVIQFIKSAA